MADQQPPGGPWDEAKSIQDMQSKISQIYFTWTTWFYGANLVAIGYFFHGFKDYKSGSNFGPLIVAMILCDVAAFLAMFPLVTHTDRARNRLAILLERINGANNYDIDLESVFAHKMVRYIYVVNPFVAGMMVCTWVFILIRVFTAAFDQILK